MERNSIVDEFSFNFTELIVEIIFMHNSRLLKILANILKVEVAFEICNQLKFCNAIFAKICNEILHMKKKNLFFAIRTPFQQ